jgi:hypothetical protein
MTEDAGIENQQTTSEERIRMVARQVSEPRRANWIASEADWPHGLTKCVLERLVDGGILHRDDTGGHTTYSPDYRRQAIKESIRLRDSDHTVEDLTERLTKMNAQIRGWKEEFDVEAPNQLRGSVADQGLDVTEEDRRREIAREWEQLQRRIEIVSFAIREWDFLAPETERSEAPG